VTSTSDRRQNDSASSAQPLRLLVVDDDPAYRAYIAVLTRRLGFWVDTADDGESALQRLARGSYDLAIIDYEMPRLSGLQTISRIRADEALKALYAIMLTAREDMDTKLTALDAGFDDFLTKYSSEQEIVAKLVAGRRIALRQRTMDVALRDLYGLATRDDLTGVFNRRFFISESERLLAEGTVITIVLLDLDGFKYVNDTYGHLAGDEVLRDVGTALQRNTRPDDIVARFGGDEFVIAVPHLDIPTVERIAGRVTQAVAALSWSWSPASRIGMSAGIASSSLLENATLAQLVNVADRDMYKNKWIRKHPDLRPELYEYPAQDRDAVERLLKVAGSGSAGD
jgi:diguanylate cyclase (GGDEF)-like protein